MTSTSTGIEADLGLETCKRGERPERAASAALQDSRLDDTPREGTGKKEENRKHKIV
jgi:hypothetical protein